MKHNWEYKPLGECFSYIKNGANIKQSKDAGGYPITRIETLANGVFNRDRVGFADITDLSIYKNHILRDGDLLMSHINSKTYVGRTIRYSSKPNEVFIHGMNLLRLTPYEWLNSQYFYYFTNSHLFKSKIINIRKDAVNQSSFSISDLKKIPIPVPPMEVQEQIVAELDKINELIEVKREQLKQLDALAQSLFYDTFGDPVTNPKGWEIVKWDLLFETILGKMLDKNKQVESDEVLPYLANQNVQWGTFNLKNLNTMTFSAKEKSKFKLRKGDILICEGGESGRCAIWQDEESDILFQKAVHRARIKDSNIINPYFVRFWLEFLKKNDGLKNYIVKSTIEHLTGMKLKTLPVPVPPLSLQNQFAAQVEAIEAQKATVEKSIAELQTLLDSRMDYWFN